jgi:chitinase
VAALAFASLAFASPAAAGPDRKAPTTPGNFRVTGVTPYFAHLAWDPSTGAPIDVGTGTSYAVDGLSPKTTQTFTVEARDFWQNVSPSSNTVTATTSAVDPNDTTPPTMPGNLDTGGMVFQDGETWLRWTASTDNDTPASRIVYRVIVNAVLDHALLGDTRAIIYVPVGQTSRIDIVAVDDAGNESAPATISVTP